jgi:hypothetical protein
LVYFLRKADFQPLENKTTGKIPSWNGKFITVADRTVLVKYILATRKKVAVATSLAKKS